MGLARIFPLAASLALVSAGGVLSPIAARTAERVDCGETTLEGTIVESEDADGILECGPGQSLVVRTDIAQAFPTRVDSRRELATLFTLSDFQYVDEESPLRGEWADKCMTNPTDSAFRPHETMVGHLMEGHVRAANRIAAGGGPVLGRPFDLSLALGDLADNQQYNETRFFIDLLDGGRLVNPDSGNDPVLGGDGYDGVQDVDPRGDPGNPLQSPVAGERIVDLANEPFWAAGLRNPDGSPIPWYTVLGNHDMKVQGTIADDDPAWRAFVRQWVRGRVKVTDLEPSKQQEACAGGFSRASFWTELFTSCATDPLGCGGTTETVPADESRRLLDRAEWIAEHFATSGVPVGHGFAEESRRCPSASPQPFARGCYTFDHGLFRFIVLDTNPAEGLSEGNIDEAQFRWLEEELKAASQLYYRSDGTPVRDPDATNRLIVVATHHTISTLNNSGPRTGADPGSKGAILLGPALRDLLLRFPNVILQVSGHTHQNKIWAHASDELPTAYWEVNTAAVADYPTQSRTIEISDNRDGTMSIFAVTFDAAVPPDPREIDWAAHDHTHETGHGASGDVNEDWLASAGREVQYHDPQQQRVVKLGTPADRNVELLVNRPFQLPSPKQLNECLKAAPEGIQPIFGTNTRDVLSGTSGPDVICTFGGRDTIRGLEGDDIMLGGPGNDRLRGGMGDDRVVGGSGRDSLKGHKGTDTLAGGKGRDVCGARGPDTRRSCRARRHRAR